MEVEKASKKLPKKSTAKAAPSNEQPAAVATKGAVFYRIQILSTENKAENEPAISEARTLGEVTSEWLDSKHLYRHLLGDFADRTIALDVLRKVKANGYPQAFLVKYVDGKRQ